MAETNDSTAWSDALLVANIVAVDPRGLGGVSIRSFPGQARDAWLAYLRDLLPPSEPFRKIPTQIGDDRLLGSLDLTATLQHGKPVLRRGLLAESDGGFVLLPMAERLAALTRAHITGVLDSREISVQRDGLAHLERTSFAVIAFDEGADDSEGADPQLLDRLAFLLDFSSIARDPSIEHRLDRDRIQSARVRIGEVRAPEALCEMLCKSSMQLGVASIRVSLFAIRAACAIACLAGRMEATIDDAKCAARLVIAPRATQIPDQATADHPEESDGDQEPSDPADQQAPRSEEQAEDESADSMPSSQDDIVLNAAIAAIPPRLLQRIRQGTSRNAQASRGRAGALRHTQLGGRPTNARRGLPERGARIHLIETLRAAAPWQPVRRRARQSARSPRLIVHASDLRIVRFLQRTQTTTIFVVDASGSAALNRLAEAKGAVELLLSECYVRRDEVCVISFRASKAEILLAPTRSLPRAKRELAGLPGGGGTPLAAGIQAAARMTEQVRRSGRTATLVFLTDGCANVALDGSAGRQRAEAQALAAARSLQTSGVATVLIDISRRAQPQAQALAQAMGARFVWLPYADAKSLAGAVQN